MTIACACEHCGQEFTAEPEGGHRLLCGDATKADDIDRLMEGAEADVCFNSPPYAHTDCPRPTSGFWTVSSTSSE